MFLREEKNRVLSASLILTVVTAEIGLYALDKHIPHLDAHNHPREAAPQTFNIKTVAIGTSASATAITGDFYSERFVSE